MIWTQTQEPRELVTWWHPFLMTYNLLMTSHPFDYIYSPYNILWLVLDPKYTVTSSKSAVQLHYKPSPRLCLQGPWFKRHVFRLNHTRLGAVCILVRLSHLQCMQAIMDVARALQIYTMKWYYESSDILLYMMRPLKLDGAFMWIFVSWTNCFPH